VKAGVTVCGTSPQETSPVGPVIPGEFIGDRSFQGLDPSPIFNKFVSISKPGSPEDKTGLFSVQFADVSLLSKILYAIRIYILLYISLLNQIGSI
jgi:hypothetical protein